MQYISLITRVTFGGVALFVLAGCSDATGPIQTREPLAPSTATERIPAISPALLIAVADADTRLTPALDADARVPMHVALTQLHDALAAGDVARGVRAIAVVRALVAGHQGEHASHNIIGLGGGDAVHVVGADGADLSALALLADAVDMALRSNQ